MTTDGKKGAVVIGTSGPRGETDRADVQSCDGIHDEGASPQYLRTKCFPDALGVGRDLTGFQSVEYDESDESRRDEDREME